MIAPGSASTLDQASSPSVFFFFFFLILLAITQGMWDLSSLTRE